MGGYKLGGVFFISAELLEKYWLITTGNNILILGIFVILMNIGLMFIKGNTNTERQSKQNEIDKIILNKFKKENLLQI